MISEGLLELVKTDSLKIMIYKLYDQRFEQMKETNLTYDKVYIDIIERNRIHRAYGRSDSEGFEIYSHKFDRNYYESAESEGDIIYLNLVIDIYLRILSTAKVEMSQLRRLCLKEIR